MANLNKRRPGYDPKCLHCVIHFAVNAWAKNSLPREGSKVVLDIGQVIVKLAEAIGEYVHRAEDPATIEQFERFARSALEAAFHYERTGELTELDTGPAPDRRH